MAQGIGGRGESGAGVAARQVRDGAFGSARRLLKIDYGRCSYPHWLGSPGREFAAQRKAAGLKAIPLGKLRHSNISRMRAAGVAADVVAVCHAHTERLTQAVYGRVTDDRLTAASAVFAPRAIGQS